MSAKRGQAISGDSPDATDWNSGFMTHSAEELRAEIAKRRIRGPNELPLKEQVAVRYSPEVFAYLRSTGAGWQTRIDDVLMEHVKKMNKK
jgi:uncharacterized protein (DUF4415 family)